MSPNEFYIFDQRDLLKTHTNFEWATQDGFRWAVCVLVIDMGIS
jgi:hypothetical protein